MKKHPMNNPLTGYLFILPQFLLFALFTIYPICEGFRISLYKTTAISNTFVGLSNYWTLFSDAVFLKSIGNTVVLVVTVTSLTLIFGLFISIAIFDKRQGYVSTIRVCYYLPVVVSTVVMSMVWKFLLNPASGLIPYFLRQAGLGSSNPLGDKNLAIWLIAFVTIVASVGQAIIMYVASIGGISTEIFEAAEVDGAGKFRRAFSIILPLSSPTTLYLAVTNIIAMLKLFVIVQLLTDGGPSNASMTMMYYLYRNMFVFDKPNIAASIGVVMFLIALVIALPMFWVMGGMRLKKSKG